MAVTFSHLQRCTEFGMGIQGLFICPKGLQWFKTFWGSGSSLAVDQPQCDLLLSLMIAHDSRTMSWNYWSSCIVIGRWLTTSCLSRADLLGGAGSSGAAGFSGALAAISPFCLATGSSGPRMGIPTAAQSLLVMDQFLLIVVGRKNVS